MDDAQGAKRLSEPMPGGIADVRYGLPCIADQDRAAPLPYAFKSEIVVDAAVGENCALGEWCAVQIGTTVLFLQISPIAAQVFDSLDGARQFSSQYSELELGALVLFQLPLVALYFAAPVRFGEGRRQIYIRENRTRLFARCNRSGAVSRASTAL